MKKTMNFLLMFAVIFALTLGNLMAQKAVLKRQVLGTGGMVGSVNNADVKMNAMTGQIAIENKRAIVPGSTNYNLNQVFWVPEPKKGTGVEEPTVTYNRDLLNYPNPVNNSTTIEYNLPAGGYISINVYDMIGNEVKSLVNAYHPAGKYTIVWDTKNENGLQVGAGSYLYEMQVNSNDLAGATASNNYVLRNVMVIAR